MSAEGISNLDPPWYNLFSICMSKKGQFIFLGTAASAGVPVIGCQCPVCHSSHSQNIRLRPSGVIRVGRKRFLIDVGPDFRQQALQHGLDDLDALLLTHTHYDHIAGIDELRVYYLKDQKRIPCFLSQESLSDLKKRYDYLFQKISGPTLSAQLDFFPFEKDHGMIDVEGLPVQYMSYFQAGTKVSGFRLGDFAYISDIREYDESLFIHLKGVSKLVLSALRDTPSPLHFSLDEAVAFVGRVKPEKTLLTHISHALDHEKTNRRLPPSIQLAFDGDEMEFTLA